MKDLEFRIPSPSMTGAGFSIPLAPTIGPLVSAQGLSPRAALQLVADDDFRHVQLSAALESMRPRDLGKTARRDLTALMRRLELSPAGIDLWIPETHFTDPTHVDRAVNAVLEAIELAADLERVPLSVLLPSEISAEIAATLGQRADVCGVPLADHNPESRSGWRIGVDPAVDLMHGVSSDQRISRADNLAAVRFSDASKTQRVVPGTGRLDILALQIAMNTRSFNRPCALDLRSLAQPVQAMRAARRAWDSANPLSAD